MEKIGPGTFVRYHPEGKRSDHRLAFVLGLAGAKYENVLICTLEEKLPLQIVRAQCTVVPPCVVSGGLIGFIGHHSIFKWGEIVSEEKQKGVLHLLLVRGNRSMIAPITTVTLSYPCTPYA